MNCEKLHQDIEKLRSLHDSLSSQLEASTESGQGKIKLTESFKEAITLEDQTLESYLEDFAEHNSEVNGWHLTDYSEKLNLRSASTMAILSNGDLAIGSAGYVYVATKDKNGDYIHKQRIKLPDIDESYLRSIVPLSDGEMLAVCDKSVSYILDDGKIFSDHIKPQSQDYRLTTATVISDDEILIGGRNGLLFSYHSYGVSGLLDVSIKNDRISGFKNIKNENTDVEALVALPDGSALIGGYDGAFYQVTKKPDNHWELSERIKVGMLEQFGIGYHISSINALSGNSALVGNPISRELCYIVKDQKEGWGVESYSGYMPSVNTIEHLPDGRILIGGDRGELCSAKEDANGNWVIDAHITGFVAQEGFFGQENNNNPNIKCITVLPDGSAMIGGFGALYRATYEEPTLATLKEHLDKIIAKANQ